MKSPLHIELGPHALTLCWPGGITHQIGHRAQRRACLCAECKRARIERAFPHVYEDIAVVEVRPIGYGVQLSFSDGHARGIFPWAYLDELRGQPITAER